MKMLGGFCQVRLAREAKMGYNSRYGTSVSHLVLME